MCEQCDTAKEGFANLPAHRRVEGSLFVLGEASALLSGLDWEMAVQAFEDVLEDPSQIAAIGDGFDPDAEIPDIDWNVELLEGYLDTAKDFQWVADKIRERAGAVEMQLKAIEEEEDPGSGGNYL